MWLDFFKSKNHEVIPSASLIPYNDPTLLWINAGVAPLKKYFDGREKPNNPRMTNAQKSIRTNDIDNVGRTSRHHTFFEMLGNFSIGDYFRNEVIDWASELLFSDKWFGFPKELIFITYYPTDKDTFNKWVENGVDPSHLIPLEDNFWEIGEGPCGPDTEIFFDRGEKYDPEKIGIRLLEDDIDNDRYIEIWNIVFSQFNSKSGVARKEYPELPSKNIDTGSGLERLACIFQGTETNYETDLFLPLINYVEEYSHQKYESNKMAFRVIADHIRSVTFAIADGAMLSNEGRGYVLRRILRRAVRYGKKLGINEPFLYKMVSLVVDNMKSFYPYLIEKQPIIEQIIKTEEENFLKTLENGEKKLHDIINSNKNNNISSILVLMHSYYMILLAFQLNLLKK
jgi:alanyl-tRNA synthetase